MSSNTPIAEDQRLQDVMGRMSAHLDRMADLICEVEEATLALRHAATCERPSHKTLESLQNLDFLRQYAEDLGILFLLLARLERCDVLDQRTLAHLAQNVRLEQTRAVLTPPTVAETLQTTAREESGDLDLF